ncbi:MAG: hypothetical protein K5669_12790 [Lachnospiraceae bacterium]|nr:hypothetical protein [Lachnospiraceae bacterium]
MPFQIVRNDISKMHVDAIADPERYIDSYISSIGGNDYEEAIKSGYKTAMENAASTEVESIAIPLLSDKDYGLSERSILRIALSEIESFLSDKDICIYLSIHDEKSVPLSSELYGDIDDYINENYVSDEKPLFKSPLPQEDAFVGASPNFFDEEEDEDGFIEEDGCIEEEGFSGGKFMTCAAPAEFLSRSLEDVISNLDKTFMEMVFSFADERGMTDVEVQKKANLDRKAFSKLKCGTTKNPSKSTALALAIALRLSLDETKDLLSRAGYALSPCSRQDVIVRYFIEHEAYDIFAVNVALFEHKEPVLGSFSE